MHGKYLQSHVTPTQTIITQTIDDTPIIATRIITADHTDTSTLQTGLNKNSKRLVGLDNCCDCIAMKRK